MIEYVLVVILSLVVFHIYTRYGRCGRMVNKILGPLDVPFLGNLWRLYGTAEYLWYTLHEMMDEYYPIAKIWLSTRAIVIIRHPDDLEVLLSSKVHTEKGKIYSFLDMWFQDGLIMSKGEKWQMRRKLLTTTFHLDNLKKYVDVTSYYTDKMLNNIKSCGPQSDVEVSSIFYKTLLSIFCGASMNVELEKLNENLVDDYKMGMEGLFQIAIYRLVRPYITNWMMPFLSIGRDGKKFLQSIFRLREELVQERRQYHESTNYRYLKHDIESDDVVGERKKKLSMLDHLLLAQREGLIDEQGLNEEVDDMLAAGHETAAAMMIYVTMLLAENKEAQEIARKEVVKVFNEANGKLTLTDIQKLEYVDRCIKESMRLYASAPLFLRHLREDLHLNNYTIPAGVDVMVMASGTHKDPKFWPEPNKFDPDRFLPHLMEKRHPYAYVPFSAGPRNCIGQKLAIIQMKILVAKILYNFHLEPIDLTADLRFNASITLHPINPVHTKFIYIDRN